MNVIEAHKIRVGQQIRKARLHTGLSHDKFAARVGTGRQHLIKLEKGMHLPGPELLAAIARESGKSPEFFESDDDEDSSSMPLTREEFTLLGTLMSRLGSSLPVEEKK